MQRITITLPDDLADDIRREARRRHTSVSEVVRGSVANQLGHEPGKPRRYKLIGLYSGPVGFSAAELDEELAKTWADDIRKSMNYNP